MGYLIPGKFAAGKGYLIKGGKKQEIDSNLRLTGKDGSQFFKSPTKMDFTQLEGVSVQEWLDKNVHDSNDSEIIRALIRLNTYGNDPDIQSIGSVLQNLYGKSRRLYVFGSWMANACRWIGNRSQKFRRENYLRGKGH